MKRITILMDEISDPSGTIAHDLKKFLSSDYHVDEYFLGGYYDCVIAPKSVSMRAAVATIPNFFLIEDIHFNNREFEVIKTKIDERIRNQKDN